MSSLALTLHHISSFVVHGFRSPSEKYPSPSSAKLTQELLFDLNLFFGAQDLILKKNCSSFSGVQSDLEMFVVKIMTASFPFLTN